MNPLFAALTAVVLSLMVVGGDASAAHKPAHETSARKSAPAAKQSSKHADKKAEKKAEKKSAKKVDKKADKKAEKQLAKQADKPASKAVSSRSVKSKAVESKAVESVSKGQRHKHAEAKAEPPRRLTRAERRREARAAREAAAQEREQERKAQRASRHGKRVAEPTPAPAPQPPVSRAEPAKQPPRGPSAAISGRDGSSMRRMPRVSTESGSNLLPYLGFNAKHPFLASHTKPVLRNSFFVQTPTWVRPICSQTRPRNFIWPSLSLSLLISYHPNPVVPEPGLYRPERVSGRCLAAH